MRLSILVFDPSPAAEFEPPVLFLAGGPGTTSLISEPRNLRGWRWWADDVLGGRALIVFDQRGSGASLPRLDCPGSSDPRLWAGATTGDPASVDPVALYRDFMVACRDRFLRRGVDLTAYGSQQIALDVIALLDRLGHETAVLFGNSYGTRLALTIARDHPNRVAALVLDSVLPPGPIFGRYTGVPFAEALQTLFEACAAQARCRAAFPALPEDLPRAAARLAEEPLTVEVVNTRSPEPLHLLVDDYTMLDILYFALFDRRKIAHLPSLIHGLAEGEGWRITAFAEDYLYSPLFRSFDAGASHSIFCHDLVAGRSLDEATRLAGLRLPYLAPWARLNWENSACRVWPSGAANAALSRPVESDRPALLLAGAFDSVTPPSLARFAAEGLPRSHLFVFPGEAHGPVWSSRCARSVVRIFLADPGPRPAPACLADQRHKTFSTLGSR